MHDAVIDVQVVAMMRVDQLRLHLGEESFYDLDDVQKRHRIKTIVRQARVMRRGYAKLRSSRCGSRTMCVMRLVRDSAARIEAGRNDNGFDALAHFGVAGET